MSSSIIILYYVLSYLRNKNLEVGLQKINIHVFKLLSAILLLYRHQLKKISFSTCILNLKINKRLHINY